ncbi:hypothetical protein DVH24_039707 [Malus domestica]|uniref:Uncharacterized protein n=1 Tax=Malus domestica TaxID=3750 RepID=A0A498I2F2_MALDO|nr:hypothetical protein DVH24_039707 [Malus domestica]
MAMRCHHSDLEFEAENIRLPWTQPRMTILIGFSKNLLKLLSENDGEIGLVHFMEAAISKEEY